MPRHAAEGLRGVARRDVADVELAAGEDGVAAVVLGEVGPDVESILELHRSNFLVCFDLICFDLADGGKV